MILPVPQLVMATTIYLLRHVESLPGDIVAPTGFRQAQDIAHTLAHIGVDVIVSSPSLRAIATVKPFSESAGIPIEIENDLRERQVARGLIGNYLSVLEESWSFKLPGCESARECQQRVLRCVRGIARRHSGKDIVASSHGNAIALLLNSLDSSFGFEAWKKLRNLISRSSSAARVESNGKRVSKRVSNALMPSRGR